MVGKKLTGTVLDERFQITSEIGFGGFGVVYRGWDLVLNREVAIKIIQHKATEEELQRFRREAQLLGSLSHANITMLYSSGATLESTPYLIMEYLKGMSLQKYLNDHGKIIDFNFFKEVFSQCCSGLDFAHRAGITHRDISPANIFLCGTGSSVEVKLLDFGLSKSSFAEAGKTVTETGMLVGNPLYMSPEQARGDKADQRSDIYSLGCVMYEAVMGTPPFESDTSVGLLYLQQSLYPQQPQLNFGSDSENSKVASTILKCIQKEPDKRFQSCAEITVALSSASDTLEIGNCTNWRSSIQQYNASKNRERIITAGVYLIVLLATISILNAGKLLELAVKVIDSNDADVLSKPRTNFAEFLAQNKQGNLACSLLQAQAKYLEKRGNLFEAADSLLRRMELNSQGANLTAAESSFQDLLRLTEKIPDSQAKADLLERIRVSAGRTLSQNFAASPQSELLRQLCISKFSKKSSCFAQFCLVSERFGVVASAPTETVIATGKALLEYMSHIHKLTKSGRNFLDDIQISLEGCEQDALSRQIWEQRIKHALQSGDHDPLELKLESARCVFECNHHDGEVLASEILNDRQATRKEISKCWYLEADMAFAQGKYLESVEWCNKILGSSATPVADDDTFSAFIRKYESLAHLHDEAQLNQSSKALVDSLSTLIVQSVQNMTLNATGESVSIQGPVANQAQSLCVRAIDLLGNAKKYSYQRQLMEVILDQIQAGRWTEVDKSLKFKILNLATSSEDSSCRALFVKASDAIKARNNLEQPTMRLQIR